MFKQASTILNLPVISAQTERKLGQVLDFIPDSNSPKILALVTEQSYLFKKPQKIFSVVSVLDIIRDAVVVKDEDSIVSPQEIVRASESIKGGIKLLGSKVKTESGGYLGRVSDFVFEMPGFNLSKLYIKGFLSVLGEEKVVDASKIRKITSKAVIVSDDVLGKEISGVAEPA